MWRGWVPMPLPTCHRPSVVLLLAYSTARASSTSHRYTCINPAMAAYSAYRHVELDKVGFGKRRVLKPPGGGTSDMFASPPDQVDSPRRNARPAATLQLGDSNAIPETDVPVFKSGNDSHAHIFGNVKPAAMNRHTHFASNMPWNGSQLLTKNQNLPVKSTDGITGESNDLVSDYSGKPGVNAVTADGYDGGKSSEASPQNGNTPTVLRNRVPPGGYSSGLW